jgi:hypothetical protein
MPFKNDCHYQIIMVTDHAEDDADNAAVDQYGGRWHCEMIRKSGIEKGSSDSYDDDIYIHVGSSKVCLRIIASRLCLYICECARKG